MVPGAPQLRSLEELSRDLRSRRCRDPTSHFLPQSETGASIGDRATSLREKPQPRARTHSPCAFVFTVRLGNIPYFLPVTDALRQLCAHVLT